MNGSIAVLTETLAEGRQIRHSGTQAAREAGNMVDLDSNPTKQRLVRRAWRSAQRLGAELDLLWVRPPAKQMTPESDKALRALGELASVLGTRLFVEESDDIPKAVAQFADRRGTTYILMGQAREPRGLARLRTPLPQRLIRRLPGVDVRIVADRARRHQSSPDE